MNQETTKVARTKYHLAQDIEGAIRNWKFPKDYRNVFKKDDGTFSTPEETRSYLFDKLREGKHLLPIGNCEGFDFVTGCPGHPATDEEAR